MQQSPFQIATLAEATEFASQMAKAKLLPAHLQNSPADCLRVVMQASRWQFDPFAVAEKTSVIGGKMMYEGQLVSAVVNSRGNLKKRLAYDFSGEGTSRVLVVRGTLAGEDEERTITLTHSQACKINKNGQMQQNPDQQMCYIGARIWARRHAPELMLGVYTPDEISEDELINVTPGADNQNDNVPARPAAPERSKKGAAAAKEAAAQVTTPPKAEEKQPVVDVPATPVATPPPAPKAEEKPVTPPAAKSEPAAGAKALPVIAQDKAEVFVSVMVRDIVKKEVNGKPNSVVAEIEGCPTAFYHLGGGDDAAWQTSDPVTIKGTGKLVKSQNKLIFLVSEISKAGGDLDI
jgi:hypothetical protein